MTVFFTVTAVKKPHRNHLELLAPCLADALVLGSSDKEQLTYNETRLSGLKEITETLAGYRIRLRLFTGDNPARH